MTEVEYGGGGHRTRPRDLKDQLLCLWGAPALVYKGARARRPAKEEGAPRRSPTPTGSRTPSFPSPSRRGEGRKRGEEGKGARRPLLVLFGLKGEGAAGQERARQGGVLLPPGVGLPPFLVQLGEGKEGKEKEKEGEGEKGGKGGRPPSTIQFGLGGPRALPPLFHHLAHEAHCFFLVFP